MRGIFLEIIGPGSVEIDSIGQHQPGQRVDGAGRYEVLNALLGLVLDPAINGQTAGIRRAAEIQRPESGAVILGQQVEVWRQERISLLPPEGIDDI